MSKHIKFLNKVLLPDGTAIPLNKNYAKGRSISPAKSTFLPLISKDFNGLQNTAAASIGKTIQLTAEIKNTIVWNTNNNDGTSGDSTNKSLLAEEERIYNVAEMSPIISSKIILLPKEDYAKVGYRDIIPMKVNAWRGQLMKLVRNTILDQAINEAKTYNGYKADAPGTLELDTPTASVATDIDGIVEEINTLYHVGAELPEVKLYEKDAIIKIVNAVQEKFADIGVSTDVNHPSIIDGISSDQIICITSRKVINAAAKTDRITQIVNLPGGLEFATTSIGGIKFVEDTILKTKESNKARMLFIVASEFMFKENPLQGETYYGKVDTGTTRAIAVDNGSGGSEVRNIIPNEATLTFQTSAYAGMKLRGMALLVRCAD